MEFLFVVSENSQVVNIADVMTDAVSELFPDIVIERFEDCVREPLRNVKPDLDTVLDDTPNEAEKSLVLDLSPEKPHNLSRREGGIKFLYVQLGGVLCAFLVFLEPLLNSFPGAVRAPAWYAPATIEIHSAHEDRGQDLNDHVVNVLIRP